MENAKIPLGSMSAVGFSEHMSDFTLREFNKFKHQGPAFGCFASVTPSLIPTDPELLKEILVRNFESFHDRGFPYNKEVDPLSSHLFFMNGQEWKDLRAKLSPTFTSGRMKMMFPIVEKIGDRMVEYLKTFAVTNESFEVKN
jgi:cytochrome P450 family 6